MPDLLALVLIFWCVHQPRKMGIGVAWLLGLRDGRGQRRAVRPARARLRRARLRRAACCTAASSGSRCGSRRCTCSCCLLASQLADARACAWLAGGTFPGCSFFVGSLIAAALWPLATLRAARAAAAAGGSRRDATDLMRGRSVSSARDASRDASRVSMSSPSSATSRRAGASRSASASPARSCSARSLLLGRASSTCRSSSTTTTRPRPRTTASRSCRSCPTAA